jgi:hypothetical protein
MESKDKNDGKGELRAREFGIRKFNIHLTPFRRRKQRQMKESSI